MRGWQSAVRWALFLYTTMGLASAGAAAEPFDIVDASQYTRLTPHLSYYLEDEEPLEAAEALRMFEAGEFTPHEGEGDLALGMMKGTAWAAITLRNLSDSEHLIVKFDNPRLSYVDLYEPMGDRFKVHYSGSARPFDVRDVRFIQPSFRVSIPIGETRTLLLRCQNLGDMRIRLGVISENEFIGAMGDKYTFERMLAGALVLLAIYQFIVFLSLREVGYAYLSLFTFSWLLFYLAGSGVGPAVFWPSGGWFPLRSNTLSSILMAASFVMFTANILDAKRRTPRLHLVANIFVAGSAVYFLYCCFTHTAWRIPLNQVLVITAMTVPGLMLVHGLRRGYRRAYIFMITWLSMVLGGAYMVLVSFAAAPATLLTETPLPGILITASVLSWTFDLTGRVKLREQLQQEILETQVRERTRELEDALSEVKTLSGMLPICSSCKRVRDDSGYWSTVEKYVSDRTNAQFSHGICPDCRDQLYPEFSKALAPGDGRQDSNPTAESSPHSESRSATG